MIQNRLIRREMQKKKFLVAVEIDAAVFYERYQNLGNYWLNQKDFIQSSLKLRD